MTLLYIECGPTDYVLHWELLEELSKLRGVSLRGKLHWGTDINSCSEALVSDTGGVDSIAVYWNNTVGVLPSERLLWEWHCGRVFRTVGLLTGIWRGHARPMWYNHTGMTPSEVGDNPAKWAHILTKSASQCHRALVTQALSPRDYLGPPLARAVVVGQGPDSAIPFSSQREANIGVALGEAGLQCGWTYASRIPPQAIRDRPVIVALGARARQWVRYEVGRDDALTLPHPTSVLKSSVSAHIIQTYTNKIRTEITEAYNGSTKNEEE